MKKIISIVIAIVLVIALAIGVYYFKIKARELSIDNVLIQGPVFYVRFCDVEKNLQEFKENLLWMNIKDIDIERLLKKSGLLQFQLQAFREQREDFLDFLSTLSLNEFFGQEVALAIYAPEKAEISADVPLEYLSNIILVTRLSPDAEFGKLVSKLSQRFNLLLNISKETYKDKEISIIEIGGNFSIAYAKIEDLLIISAGKSKVQACLDVINKDKTPLSKDNDYLAVSKEILEPDQFFVYANLNLFFSSVRGLIETASASSQLSPKVEKGLLESFEQMAGFQTMGVSSVSGKISKQEAVLFFDKYKMPAQVARTYSFKPGENRSLNFAPKELIVYQWSNSFDSQGIWEELERGVNAIPETKGLNPREIIQGIEDSLDLSIADDILPSLGNEIGGFLSDVDMNGPVPIPQFLIFIELKDRGVSEQIMATLTEGTMFSFKSEDYKGTTVKYISLPFGQTVEPGYCFIDDYLLISISRRLLNSSIDAFNDKSLSLLKNTDFKALNLGLTEKNNSLLFVKTDLLFQKIRQICGWGYNWFSFAASSAQASQEALAQDVGDSEAKIKSQGLELRNLNLNLQAIKAEILDFKSQGLDVYDKEQRRANLESEIQTKQDELSLTKRSLEANQQRLKEMEEGMGMQRMDPSLVGLYLEAIVYPFLDGLAQEKAFALRTIIEKDVLRFQMFSLR